jgi:hypothetical protein
MSYFDDASLVMIPSGYKTSKAYSVKPTDGTGDLTFTRSNDTATRVGPDGLIEKVRTNLLTYSNNFSNAAWTKINVTLTSGQVDPNGGTNGTRVQYAGVSYINQTPSTAFATASVYARATSGTASIRISDSTGNSPTQYNLTETWQRISTSGSAMAGMNIDSFIGGSWTAQDVIIAFAQFETGDIATDYIATTTAAVSVGPVANVPRLDYLNSSCPRLLLEPQRTNLVTYSEQFNNAAWDNAGGAVVSANTAVAPDGTTSADTATFAVASKILRQFQTGLSASASYTFTAYVKKSATSGANNVRLSINDTGSWVGAGSTKIALTNSWQRISLTWTASTSAYLMIGALDQNGTADTSCYGNVDVWGAQFEAGAYPTSYIPTLGAAVTRGADNCVNSSATSIIGQTEGVVYFEWEYQNTGSSGGNIVISLDGGTGNEIYFWVQTNGNFFYEVVNSTLQAQITGAMGSFGTKKIALAYKNNDFALYINGVLAGTDTSGSVPTLDRLYVGRYFANTTYNIASGIKQVLLFPTRLSNADLAALTA